MCALFECICSKNTDMKEDFKIDKFKCERDKEWCLEGVRSIEISLISQRHRSQTQRYLQIFQLQISANSRVIGLQSSNFEIELGAGT